MVQKYYSKKFSAGSRLEQAISEGPEALQKYIDSGEIEELHDVMPHNDDDDDGLNDAYIDEDDDITDNTKNTSQNQLNIPNSSLSQESSSLWENSFNNSRSNEINNHPMDQDMRVNQLSFINNSGSGDTDMRQFSNNFMLNKDRNYEMRKQDDDTRSYVDEDFRNMYEGQDEDEFEENYDNYQDRGDWQRNGNYRQNQFGRNNFSNANGHNNFQNFRSQNFNNDSNQFRAPDPVWNSPSQQDSNFRNRNNFRGSRGQRRGGARNPRSSPRSRGGSSRNQGFTRPY